MSRQHPAGGQQTARFGSEINVWINKKFGPPAIHGEEDSCLYRKGFGAHPRHSSRQVMGTLKDHVRLPVDPGHLKWRQKIRWSNAIGSASGWVGNVKISP